MTSGELLKYRKGLCIAGGYGTPVSVSSQFGLTLPCIMLHSAGLAQVMAKHTGFGYIARGM
jgi:hypothetical protein